MNIDTRERFTLRIPKPLFFDMKIKAEEKGVSVNALILQILWDWVERHKQWIDAADQPSA